LKLVVARVGKGRTNWADEACADWQKRLARRLPIEELLVEPEPFRGDVDAVRQAEAARLLDRVRPSDRLIAVDERGEAPTSEGFAAWIEGAAAAGTGRVVFALGGPYGHGPLVRERAWKVLALSSMVLNHELARAVLFEQLYRASTLIWGGSYHH
jgi:23S rRNA (pseudouridine1915-N3)-methyltransferase